MKHSDETLKFYLKNFQLGFSDEVHRRALKKRGWIEYTKAGIRRGWNLTESGRAVLERAKG